LEILTGKCGEAPSFDGSLFKKRLKAANSPSQSGRATLRNDTASQTFFDFPETSVDFGFRLPLALNSKKKGKGTDSWIVFSFTKMRVLTSLECNRQKSANLRSRSQANQQPFLLPRTADHSKNTNEVTQSVHSPVSLFWYLSPGLKR
jgi:hypothetical protein